VSAPLPPHVGDTCQIPGITQIPVKKFIYNQLHCSSSIALASTADTTNGTSTSTSTGTTG
jgi:hypothetical protein